MPFMLALLLGAQVAPAPIWQLSDAIVVSRVSRGGRIPFPQDDLLGVLVDKGDAAVFKAGDTIPGRDGTTHTWVASKANDKGVLNQPQAGYIQAIIHSDSERPAILNVNGAGALYFNGALRPGDVYGYGYLSLPVQLRAGDNTLLVASGRGGLTAHLDAPKAAQQFNLGDPTMPDVLTTDKGELLGAVIVLNDSATPASALKIRATVGDRTVESRLPEIGPFTLRKVPFRFPVVVDKPGTAQHVGLVLVGAQGEEDEGKLDVSVVDAFTTHKRTFISNIDGSLQYYAVVPAKKPSKTNALVLTLHGASVEAIGQARAYKAKDWCTIVAATNRRPYGFDWEDIGRLDALEVLDIAKKKYPHDPARVVLTGHSMGGHGTWSIGTLYPNLFAAIAPSAGWVSFQSYAGGFRPTNPDAMEELFLEAAAPSDTLGRVRNTLEYKTYILHGDADDNVPVTEARTMKKALTDIGADFVYHEQPGAGHWWGNECVDWPPLFETLKNARLKAADDPSPVDFTTPNPQVSCTLRWVTIVGQQHAGISSVRANVIDGVLNVITKNVQKLDLRRPAAPVSEVVIDGVKFHSFHFPMHLDMVLLYSRGTMLSAQGADAQNDGWKPAWGELGNWKAGDKNPSRSGGFKQAFQHNMVFVVGSQGPDANRLWRAARYLAESLYYRGNGAVDIWTDADYLKRRGHDRSLRDRNVILFGNEDDNLAWKTLLAKCQIRVGDGRASWQDTGRGAAVVGGLRIPREEYQGTNTAALITFPLPGSDTAFIGAFGITGPGGIDAIERLPILPSGAAYPDWTIFDAKLEPTRGTQAVVGAGNFDDAWRLFNGQHWDFDMQRNTP